MTAVVHPDIPEDQLAELTPEEEAEFTAVNACAFDLLRVESQKMGKTPPVWLCLSAETRQECRSKLLMLMGAAFGFGWTNPDRTSADITRLTPQHSIDLWRLLERHYKYLRLSGNPRAFFT